MEASAFIKTDAAAEDLLNEAQSGGNFKPLSKGWYEATVKAVEIVDFAKSGKYNEGGFKALNVQLRVIEGSPEGAKRVFFARVPLFQRYLPTQKNPQGAVASMYFDFFLALGFSKEDVAGGKVSLDQASLGGKRIGMFLDVREPDEWHSEAYNEVGRVREARALEGVAKGGTSPFASAFAPATGSESPWGSTETTSLQGDSALQAAADGTGKAF